MTLRFKFALCAGLAAGLAGLSVAEPTAVGQYKDWAVFKDNGICFAATQATDKAPKAADHGDVWFYVTSWQSGRARNQPSLKVGYTMKEGLPARAKIGRSSWALFSANREAFADDADDPKIVRALKRGSELQVKATSERGTATTYHFSLSGSSAAIDKAAASCS